jgi:hypothetical protein
MSMLLLFTAVITGEKAPTWDAQGIEAEIPEALGTKAEELERKARFPAPGSLLHLWNFCIICKNSRLSGLLMQFALKCNKLLAPEMRPKQEGKNSRLFGVPALTFF